jgi:hypothetical protein
MGENRPKMTKAEADLLRWFKATRAARTRAVKNGSAPIDWLDKGTRVAWSEIWNKAQELGIKRDVVDLRTWWDTVQ